MITIGGDDIKAFLNDLSTKQAATIGRKALKAGAQVLLEASQAEAPVLTGALRSNLKIRSKRSNREHTIATSVGVSTKDFTGKSWYAGAVLWGHKVGKRPSRSGILKIRAAKDSRKEIPGNDFLARAFDSSGQEAADKVSEIWATGIEKARAKAAKGKT